MGLFNERHVRKGDKGDTMGISRDSLHKRRLTGGKQKPWRKKRKYELGRQPANTKLSSHVDVRVVAAAAATRSSARSAWTTVTSPGVPRTSPGRPASSTCATTRLTTSSCAPRLW